MKFNKTIEKHLSQMEDAKLYFEEIRDIKQESYDHKSEKFKESEKGDEMQADVEALEEIVVNIEAAYEKINEIFELD